MNINKVSLLSRFLYKYCLGWTTATLCCTMPQPAVFRSCSACRTPRHESFRRLRDSHHLSHYWNSSYTGYQFVSASTTNSSFSHTRSATRQPQPSAHHIRLWESTHHLHSSAIPLLHRLHFADRAFRCSAPAVWNSLNTDTLRSSFLALFKCSLKTFLSRQTFRPSSNCIAQGRRL